MWKSPQKDDADRTGWLVLCRRMPEKPERGITLFHFRGIVSMGAENIPADGVDLCGCGRHRPGKRPPQAGQRLRRDRCAVIIRLQADPVPFMGQRYLEPPSGRAVAQRIGSRIFHNLFEPDRGALHMELLQLQGEGDPLLICGKGQRSLNLSDQPEQQVVDQVCRASEVPLLHVAQEAM